MKDDHTYRVITACQQTQQGEHRATRPPQHQHEKRHLGWVRRRGLDGVGLSPLQR
jgi:hypothetical protein